MEEPQEIRYIPVADGAKLVRTALKTTFPGIRFSVQSRKYAGGASIDVTWIDGPTREAVEQVTNRYEGSTFDGMIDLKSSHTSELNGETVRFGAEFIHCHRTISKAFLTAVANAYCDRYSHEMPPIKISSGSAYIDTPGPYDHYHYTEEIMRKAWATNAAQVDEMFEEEDRHIAENAAQEAAREVEQQTVEQTNTPIDGTPKGGNISTPLQPRPYMLREEVLYNNDTVFRVYEMDGTPLYLGECTVEEAEARLRRFHLVSRMAVKYLEPPTQTVPRYRHHQRITFRMEADEAIETGVIQEIYARTDKAGWGYALETEPTQTHEKWVHLVFEDEVVGVVEEPLTRDLDLVMLSNAVQARYTREEWEQRRHTRATTIAAQDIVEASEPADTVRQPEQVTPSEFKESRRLSSLPDDIHVPPSLHAVAPPLLGRGERITSEVLALLKKGYCTGMIYYLPHTRLDRRLYERVNEVLVRLGGTWKRTAKGHVFEIDPGPLLDLIFTTEEMPPKNPTAFFPTPGPVIEVLLSRPSYRIPVTASRLLEPSAGKGNIACALRDYCFRHDISATIDCCELLPTFQTELGRRGFPVVAADFLNYTPDIAYDAIVMNPPFSVEGDALAYVTHIEHAWSLLASGGLLLAVVPIGLLFRTENRIQALRHLVEAFGEMEALPQGAFKESGTGVNTCLLRMRKQDESEKKMSKSAQYSSRKERS